MARVICSADPASESDVLRELRRERVSQVRALAPGVLLGEAEFAPIAKSWRTRPPIFVRHVFPVWIQTPGALPGPVVAAGSGRFTRELSSRPFSVQTRILTSVSYHPVDINEPLAAALAESGAHLDVKNPVDVVSIVVAGDPPVAYLGVSTAMDNLSGWAGGERRYSREPGQISRTEFKLMEALEVFGVALPSTGGALDLGAAPGGWTRRLRLAGLGVTAVDPAELHESLRGDPRVGHERSRAESFLPRARGRYRVILCDIRASAHESADLMVRAARLADPSALGIVTLKLPLRDRGRVVAESLRTLRTAWVVRGVKQLFHNRSEVTVALTSPGSSAAVFP
jgi:23S rRNA (cytidine2498-2'-O)-methyltransferase